MDKYEVMLYPKAIQDIEDIYEYIAIEKMAPENAKGKRIEYGINCRR